MNIGFFGCGGMAAGHMRNVAKFRDGGEDIQMAAFCDIDAGRAAGRAAEFGGRPYADFRTMLDSEKLDALYIGVPPQGHVGAEQAAAERGVALFVEKPVSNSIDTARAVREAIARSGVINSVGYNWRYQDTTEAARRALAGKTVGMAMGYWMGGMPGVPWWRRLDQSGGQFVEQTTHIFDAARYLLGEITEVTARAANRASQEIENFTVTDVGAALVTFASGAVGTFHNTCLLQGLGYTVGLHIVTPDLIVELSGNCVLIDAQGRTEIKSALNPYEAEDRAFIDAVTKRDQSLIRSPYADAVETLAVTLAANRSYQTGQIVRPSEL